MQPRHAPRACSHATHRVHAATPPAGRRQPRHPPRACSHATRRSQAATPPTARMQPRHPPRACSHATRRAHIAIEWRHQPCSQSSSAALTGGVQRMCRPTWRRWKKMEASTHIAGVMHPSRRLRSSYLLRRRGANCRQYGVGSPREHGACMLKLPVPGMKFGQAEDATPRQRNSALGFGAPYPGGPVTNATFGGCIVGPFGDTSCLTCLLSDV
jgi:hypothetical protein